MQVVLITQYPKPHQNHVETNICWSKPTLSGPSTSKCNTNINIRPKPHVEHDTCNIHIKSKLWSGKAYKGESMVKYIEKVVEKISS